jgi:methylmalonyl-CoA mutase cobalamin-binding domain/chain
MTDALLDAITQYRENEAIGLAGEMVEAGTPAADILDECRVAMVEIGRRFEAGEAFIPELMMAGEIMKGIAAVLKPHLAGDAARDRSGPVVIGTVSGDIHDIGKDIVATMLDVSGIDVIDLGVDVPPQRFIDALGESGARVVGLSCLLTTSFSSMTETIGLLERAGLRGNVRVMVGGGPVTEKLCAQVGADGWGNDAIRAVRLAEQWLAVDPAD